MRRKKASNRSFVLKCFLIGLALNFAVAYGAWIRIGLVQYDFDSRYWTTNPVGISGWYKEGSRFGVLSMASKAVDSTLPMLSFVRDPESGKDVVEHSMSVAHSFRVEDSYGWPFGTITKMGSFEHRFFVEAGLTVHEINNEPAFIETTPRPRWYTTGIPTGFNSPYKTIPIALQLRGVVFGTLFHFALIVATALIWMKVFGSTRRSKIRCFGCGKLIQNLPTCPICGLEQDQAADLSSD